jgi:hypothetical protein
MTTRWKSKRKTYRRRVEEEWTCNDWPNCPCGRASQYTTRPLYKYTTGARDNFAIADSFVILKCMSDHVPDPQVQRAALGQLIHPQYDTYHRPDEGWPWLFKRLRQGTQT